MKRPIGINVAAFALGLLALALLLLSVLPAVLLLSTGIGVLLPVVPAPHTALTLLLAWTVLFATGSVWAVFTVVGLLRLRTWARRSVLALAGLLTFFGILGVLGLAATASVLPAAIAPQQLPPGPATHAMHTGLAVDTLICTFCAALGVWWLTYFNLPSVRANFPPSPARALPRRNQRLPSPILLLALTYFTTSALFVFFLIRHLPGLFFGHAAPGVAVYAGGALAMTLAGVGLLRLSDFARRATFILLAVGMLNAIISAAPFFREPLNLFAIAVLQRLQAPHPLATAYSLTSGSLLPVIFLLLAFTLYFAHALHRYRDRFRSPAA